MAAAQAVTAAEFARVAARLGLSRGLPVVVAVSGGADSMALMHLASTYFHQPAAVTIDHTLRPESTQEAATVAKWLTERAQARHARYQLLRDVCHQQSCNHLLTGHHRDDQVETIMFRLMRGSGIDGLRGIRPITTLQELDPHLQLVRPLLSFEKSRLYATCRDHGIPWVEDPSNKKIMYQRNSIRQGLDLLYASTDVKASDISGLSETLAEASASFEQQVYHFLQQHTRTDTKFGVMTLQQTPLRSLPTPILNRVIVKATQWANASAYPPSFDSIGRLQNLIRSDWVGAGTGVAIGGAIWFKLKSASKKGSVLAVGRQPPSRPELPRLSAPIRMGEEIWWDGRYDLWLAPTSNRARDTSIDTYSVCPLTDRDFTTLFQKHAHKGLKPAILQSISGTSSSIQRIPLPPVCRQTLPALVCARSGRVLSVPHIGYVSEDSPVVLKGRLRPRHPL